MRKKTFLSRLHLVHGLNAEVRSAMAGLYECYEHRQPPSMIHQPAVAQIGDLLMICNAVNTPSLLERWEIRPVNQQLKTLQDAAEPGEPVIMPTREARLRERLLALFLVRHGRSFLGPKVFGPQLQARAEVLQRISRGEVHGLHGLELAMVLALLRDFSEFLHNVSMSIYDKKERREQLAASAA